MEQNLVLNGNFEARPDPLEHWYMGPDRDPREVTVEHDSAPFGAIHFVKISPVSHERWDSESVWVAQDFVVEGEADQLEMKVKLLAPDPTVVGGAFRVYFDQGGAYLDGGADIAFNYHSWASVKVPVPRLLTPVRGIRIVARTSIPMGFGRIRLMSDVAGLTHPFAPFLSRLERHARALGGLEERVRRLEEGAKGTKGTGTRESK